MGCAAILERRLADALMKELHEISDGTKAGQRSDFGHGIGGLQKQAFCPFEPNELDFFQNSSANRLSKAFFEMPPGNCYLVDNVVNRNIAPLFAANELQCCGDIGIFHLDDFC